MNTKQLESILSQFLVGIDDIVAVVPFGDSYRLSFDHGGAVVTTSDDQKFIVRVEKFLG